MNLFCLAVFLYGFRSFSLKCSVCGDGDAFFSSDRNQFMFLFVRRQCYSVGHNFISFFFLAAICADCKFCLVSSISCNALIRFFSRSDSRKRGRKRNEFSQNISVKFIFQIKVNKYYFFIQLVFVHFLTIFIFQSHFWLRSLNGSTGFV